MRTDRGDRHVVLTEVSTGGACGEGHIHPVVDEHRDGERRDQRAGKFGDLGGGAIFPPHLDRGRAALDSRATRGHRVASGEECGVGEHHQP